MQLSLEFQTTLADFRQLASDRRSRRSLIVRRVTAVGAILFAFHHLWTVGFDWEFGIIVVVAIIFGVPLSTVYLFIWLSIVFGRPTRWLTIDDTGVSQGSEKRKQDIPWSSFSRFGSATEFKHHFWLESGRGTVWIPKHAFRTETELTAFRTLVADKMGERCRFNVS